MSPITLLGLQRSDRLTLPLSHPEPAIFSQTIAGLGTRLKPLELSHFWVKPLPRRFSSYAFSKYIRLFSAYFKLKSLNNLRAWVKPGHSVISKCILTKQNSLHGNQRQLWFKCCYHRHPQSNKPGNCNFSFVFTTFPTPGMRYLLILYRGAMLKIILRRRKIMSQSIVVSFNFNLNNCACTEKCIEFSARKLK